MQEEPKEISTKEYAKALAVLVALVFWTFCIIIGYNIINDNKAAAVIFLLILGFCLPIVVRAVMGLIQEKHSGVETNPREIEVPVRWGTAFLFVFLFVNLVIPLLLTTPEISALLQR